MIDDPSALGWIQNKSPDLPTPCPKYILRFAIALLAILPYLYPIELFLNELLLIM